MGSRWRTIEDKATALSAFTIARVIEAKQHPNADRLRVCIVDTGSGDPIQVVCGAPNARTGMTGVFSPPGTYIPGKKITLGVGTIRGVESRGMLVSEAEMELSDDHEGIIDLPDDAPVGESYVEMGAARRSGHRDQPHAQSPGLHRRARHRARPCRGRHGQADRSGAEAREGHIPLPGRGEDRRARAVPGFALRLVRGVKNGPSPEWLQKRLIAIGLRPINALVDITNFMTFDRGRPLHVFDAAKVHGNLTVRRGRKGESLLALDGRTYQLDESICVITDEKAVESLSGIMGGEETGCSTETTDVLIESALWNPLNIAQTGRKLGINSDARYRFERGVDPNFMVPGLEMATQMVLDFCGGTPSEMIVAGSAHAEDRVIEFPVSEVKRLSGLDVPLTEMKRVLDKLGFFVAGKGETVKVAIPSWRPDIEGKADIVEEVVRIVGVDKVPLTPFERGEDAAQVDPHLPASAQSPRQARAGEPRHGRSRDMVVHRQGAGGIVRRRTGGACARKSDRRRSLRHAAEPHSGARDQRAKECGPRLP